MGPNWSCNWPIVSGAAQADGQDCAYLGPNPLNGMNLWASVDAKARARGDVARLYLNGGRQYLEQFSGNPPDEYSRIRLFSNRQPVASVEGARSGTFATLTLAQTDSIATTGLIQPGNPLYWGISTPISKDSNQVSIGGSPGVLFDNFTLEHEKETLSYCLAAYPGCLVFWDLFKFNPLAAPSPSPPDWNLSSGWFHVQSDHRLSPWDFYGSLLTDSAAQAFVNIDDPNVPYYAVSSTMFGYLKGPPWPPSGSTYLRLVADWVDPGTYLYAEMGSTNWVFGRMIGGIDQQLGSSTGYEGFGPANLRIAVGPNEASFGPVAVAVPPARLETGPSSWRKYAVVSHAPSSRRVGVIAAGFNGNYDPDDPFLYHTSLACFSALSVVKLGTVISGCPALVY